MERIKDHESEYLNNKLTCVDKYSYLIVFSVAIILRLIPEILAYPYPIGYDVINYYLPVLKHFDDYSSTISNQFPLYISLLHAISSIVNVDPRIVITILGSTFTIDDIA